MYRTYSTTELRLAGGATELLVCRTKVRDGVLLYELLKVGGREFREEGFKGCSDVGTARQGLVGGCTTEHLNEKKFTVICHHLPDY